MGDASCASWDARRLEGEDLKGKLEADSSKPAHRYNILATDLNPLYYLLNLFNLFNGAIK